MTPEEHEKLGRDYARYCQERDEMAARGKAIGTFIGWQYANNMIDIKIAKAWDEHLRITRQAGK